MAIEITTGGITKSFKYFPRDAFYVDANGSVNTSGNGRQVKEAYFNGVKYYPETSNKNVKDDAYSGGYVAKMRGDLVLTGYQPPVEDERGFMRTPGVSSYLRFVCTIIYQTPAQFVRSTLGRAWKMPDAHEDFPVYDPRYLSLPPAEYRFDGITFPADTECVLGGASRADIEFDIALSGPQVFNPVYGKWTTSNGVSTCAAVFDYDIGGPVMHEVLTANQVGNFGIDDNDKQFIIYSHTESNSKKYLCLSMTYLGKVCHPHLTTPDGYSLGDYVYTGPSFHFEHFFPQTIEYVGPVSEAPESAFVLD